MKILAVVPARAGSKRLPGKNTRLLGDRPLIAWTIAAARESNVLGDILVSTDDSLISEVGKEWGGWTPWLRPAELASDTALSMDVVMHALDWYENEFGLVDGLMLLQPTSPFRRPESIRHAVELFDKNNGQSVVSVSPSSSHPAWTFEIQNKKLMPFLSWEGIGQRSQDLQPAYTLNGAIYLATPVTLRQYRTFVTRSTIPLIMGDPAEALDIDTWLDWQLAECILKSSNENLSL
jgi:CMP-N-acetylneuraminic acid synthetase